MLTKLGCPSKVFYKDENKMMIHAAGASDARARSAANHAQQQSHYFFNYFTLGVVSTISLNIISLLLGTTGSDRPDIYRVATKKA